MRTDKWEIVCAPTVLALFTSTYSATAIKMVHGKLLLGVIANFFFHQVNVAAQNTGHPDALDHGGAE